MSDSIELITDQYASELIRSQSFQENWEILYRECRWSTPFQSHDFVVTWFQVYTDQTPVIVTRRSAGGILGALLVLTKDSSGRIEFAGTHHAEYKGWLERGADAHEFIGKAINLVREHYGPFTLELSFIYHEEQAEILERECAGVIRLSPCDREYKQLTHATIMHSLKKKGNKSKWNRLGKLGCIEFSRIVDADIFRNYLEKCSICHDVWQGAMNNCYPFSSDDLKLDFHARLFERDRDILHASAITLDNEPIAMHIGYIQNSEICYSIIAHNPVYSTYSLGKLLFLRLCELLLNEGFTSLDLSPGGDPWKKDFSSGRATAYRGVLYKNGFFKSVDSYLARLKAAASVIGVTGNRVRKLSRQARRLLSILSSSPYQRHALQIYKLNGHCLPQSRQHRHQIQKNDLSELLHYQQAGRHASKSVFLKEAIRRLTEGEDVYTYSSNGKLLAMAWLKGEQTSAYFPVVAQEYIYNPAGKVLYGTYIHPEVHNPDVFTALVDKMLADCIHKTGSNVYYVPGDSDSTELTGLMENEFGFRLFDSLHFERLFKLSRKWKIAGTDGTASREKQHL